MRHFGVEGAEPALGCGVAVATFDAEELGAAALPETAIIAFISASVTPTLCNRMSSLVEVLNLLGPDWIADTTTDSGILCFTMVITSSLVSGFCACCAADQPYNAKTLTSNAKFIVRVAINHPPHCFCRTAPSLGRERTQRLR